MSFDSLGLSAEIVRAVTDAGYTTPTPIQEQAIPAVLTGRDVLGCAQTGTGKTASFTLPMIEILAQGRAKAKMPRSLILEPTRELAAQVAENFDKYGRYHRLTKALLIGGVSYGDQEKLLDRGVDVLIATPGRLLDHHDRGRILLRDVRVLVIDEADRMLDMGFIPDVEKIVSFLPANRQTLFFSATMAPEIRRLADAFLSNPKEITVAPPASAAKTVAQHLCVVAEEDKREALRRLIRQEEVRNAIVFCNRKKDVAILHKSLTKHGFSVGAIHGDLTQATRMETLDSFKRGEITLLVASDVAARGLDIADLSHVFNFDVPIHAEDYVHRIGRTGRAGKSGRAFTIAAPDDGKFVAAVEALIGQTILRIDPPGLDSPELDMSGDRRRRRSTAKPAAGKAASGKTPPDRAAADKPAGDYGPAAKRVDGRPPKPAKAAARRPEPRAPLEPLPEGLVPGLGDQPEISFPDSQRPPVAARREPPERRERDGYERRDRRDRPDRDRPERDRPERDRPERDRSERGRWEDRDRGPVVVGFGADIPAFLARPVPLPRASKDEVKDDTSPDATDVVSDDQ
ncbi:MAG: DEAD/DEAH box helicase [Alphaproteobacteria bacterium]|nr:DEAD/DEAH box helicase [Alphaproteobacteria bacterium]